VASHSRKYYVAGEVNHAGAFDLVVPIHVSEALINAGGFKDFANKKKIRIVREVPGGKPRVFPYNDKEVSHGKNMEQNILLEPGDRIYVSGELGGSAAAIRQMRKKPRRRLNPRHYPRHFFPEPRIKLGRVLREKGLASAMIDLSDGLSTDLAHICEESGVGAILRRGQRRAVRVQP